MKHANHLQHNTYYESNTAYVPSAAIDAIGQFKSTEKEANLTRHIAEIIVPQFIEQDNLLLPMIASFSHQSSERWTTWITNRQPSKALLKKMDVDLSCLRIVYIDSTADCRWIIWQALAQGNSHTVIAEQTTFSSSDIAAMEDAAARGDCKGILVKSLG